MHDDRTPGPRGIEANDIRAAQAEVWVRLEVAQEGLRRLDELLNPQTPPHRPAPKC